MTHTIAEVLITDIRANSALKVPDSYIYDNSDIITDFHRKYLDEHKVLVRYISDTYDDYGTMAHEYAKTGIMTVSTAYNTNTIYRDNSDNLLFRAVHDHLHLMYQLTFSVPDERKIAYVHYGLLWDYLSDLGINRNIMNNILKVYKTDIGGQLDYLEQTGTFPDNQLEYVRKAS